MINITFILPTLNRKDYVSRAIQCCLDCETDRVKPRVLVIDGYSDDGSYEMLKVKYAEDHRVDLVQYDRVGFQETAFYGVSLVKTEYATFMYDDDLLSPYYAKMIESMEERGKDFVMGFGKMFHIDKVLPFASLDGKISEVAKFDFILNYYCIHTTTRFTDAPVSPICCVQKTDFLRSWVSFIKAYCEGSRIKTYYMLKKNIGPDIILFLSSILASKGNVLVADEIVGQFSYHPTSMSIGYGSQHLKVGYWLGRKWAVEKIFDSGEFEVAKKASAYLLIAGLKNFSLMFFSSKDRPWSWAYLREIIDLLKITARHALLAGVFLELFTSMRNVTARRAKSI